MKMDIKTMLKKVEKMNEIRGDLLLDGRYYLYLWDLSANEHFSLFHKSDLEILENFYIEDLYLKMLEKEIIVNEEFMINDERFVIYIKETN